MGRRLSHGCKRLWRRVVHIDDTPHRIAWGTAIGMWIAWLPIVGIQMVVSGVFCWLLRANILASLPPVWISNPLTMIPMYYFNNQLGAMFAGEAISMHKMHEVWGEVDRLFRTEGLWTATTFLFGDQIWQAFIAMCIGGAIYGLICAIPTYFLTYRAVLAFQNHRHSRRKNWQQPPPEPPAI